MPPTSEQGGEEHPGRRRIALSPVVQSTYSRRLFFPGPYRCMQTGHDQNLLTGCEDQGAGADTFAKIRILQTL